MKIALATLPNGLVNTHLGRANLISIATIEDKQIVNWEEIEVPFGENHDRHHNHEHHAHHGHGHDNHHHHHHEHGQGYNHQESIRDFMVEQGINIVLAEHSGPGIKMALENANIELVVVDIKGKAKEVVQRYIDSL